MEGWVEFRDKEEGQGVRGDAQRNAGGRQEARRALLRSVEHEVPPEIQVGQPHGEIEYQKALREQRMQLELSVAKKERDFYLQKVEQAKQIEKMRERRAAEAAGDLEKLKHLPEAPPEDREETKEEYEARMRRERARQKEERNQLLRRFKQREALGDINVDSARG